MKKIVLFLLCLGLTGCARHRDVERLLDPNGERLAKHAFTGGDAGGAYWLAKVTVTKTSTNGGFLFVGLQSETKVGHFEITKEKLKFVSDAGPFGPGSPTAVPELVNSWDITHHDVKLAESEGNVTNKEVEDDSRPWNERRFLKIQFAKADITESATFPYYVDAASSAECWQKRGAYLVDDSLSLEPDSIQFVVGVDYEQKTLCVGSQRRLLRSDYTYTVHYRYSFRKLEKSDYQPFVYQGENNPRMRRFGYFQTVREVLHPETGQFAHLFLMNRWHPGKEHHFYFTNGFPEEYKAIFADPEHGIFAKTNRLLEKHGLKLRFRIHENTWGNGKKKEFGDLRYSFVHFVPEIDPGAPFGYGPSDANPFTGEIMAANLVVWTGYLKYYLERIKLAFERDPTKFQTSSLFNAMKQALKEEDPSKWTLPLDLKAGAGQAMAELLPGATFGYPGWARFTSPGEVEPLLKSQALKTAATWSRDGEARARLEAADKHVGRGVERLHAEMSHPRNSLIYPMEETLSNATQLVIGGVSEEDILRTLVYRVSIHEFGHNLGLRHNFYGSVDSRNFRAPAAMRDSHGHPVLDEAGRAAEGQPMSSSVMEYLALEDEVFLAHDWEPYDEAAIVFGYSSGDKEAFPGRKFLYCTDEHRVLNAMCNHWDSGTSPSEVAMSLVKRYEHGYFVNNYRADRAYWDTNGYAARVFQTMWDLKRFLLLWRAGLPEDTVRRELQTKGIPSSQVEELTQSISRHMRQAVRLTVAFYNAVVQQSAADRPYQDEIEPFSGEKKRVGILYDKLYAMLFLVGDDAFAYNPNRPFSTASFLTYAVQPDLREAIERIYENSLTERVDMEPWFLGFARSLYAINATSTTNRDDIRLAHRIKVVRMTGEEMSSQLGIDPGDELDAAVVTLEASRHPYFKAGETVGIVKVHDRYYLASKFRNPYSFDLAQAIVDAAELGQPTASAKADLLELFRIYREAIGEELP